jgi:hypothetical protein
MNVREEHMKFNLPMVGFIASLLIGGVARADEIYTYSINLPSITNAGLESDAGGFTAYPFSWEGPLMFNAAAGTACPTVCGPALGTTVNPGYFFAGFSFTADLGLSDSKVLVSFDSFSNPSNQIVFSFTEPDSFWATTGTGISFPSVGGTPSFTFDGGAATACTGCSIDISKTAATPEPRLTLVLLAFLGIGGLVLERRRKLARSMV